ncbi:hypothetical protein N7489_005702 [Penicillium chrysogenum]|uniref:Uncharacterized protein n=1 Tax=Penicillium chrysogenum TaxID=5076 RepID=A0ABQ8WNK9_PENCH|nr:uncharacterized protein N7489_005702 [Penicillium chrysogenum]KAJ5245606.1 hypothetical protein N7489_005702 [Penicillium chrysogenum]KAJ5274303.1 hypothetical protein N7505_002848 [Penicillium chrysogenum]KAJ5284763.1 hypothetical protein N7524_000069 [Penicillium chrysogenum]KAJ6156014.1 hypothetical protein N7497_004899 [Penicillium chrysogenum]
MGFCNSVPYVQRQMDLLLNLPTFVHNLMTTSPHPTASNSMSNIRVVERHSVSLEPKKAYITFPEVSLRVSGWMV